MSDSETAWVRAGPLLLLGLGLVLLLLMGCGPADAPRPNVLLITLDTVRADHLSCYGYGRETSPHLDRLAEDGIRFDEFVAVSSWTLPTHGSLFTGLFPTTHGAHYAPGGDVALSDALRRGEVFDTFKANRLPESALTLAEVLQSAGYVTHGVGAGPWLKPQFGLAQGFLSYDGDVSALRGRRAAEVNALALPFLRERREEPFFLFLNYFDAHDPYLAPAPFADRFVKPAMRKKSQAEGRPTPKMQLARYDAEIRYADAHLGAVIDELKSLGVYDDTWILVVSDHGEQFGEHDLKGHGFSLFEGEIQGAFVMKPPADWPVAYDSTERCQHVDVMPTVLEGLGVPAPGAMEGQALGSISHPAVSELFRNEGNVQREGPRFDRDLKAIYSGSSKLIWSSRPDDTDAGLFDLATDAAESSDVSGEQPDEAQRLLRELSAWRASLVSPLSAEAISSLDEETEAQLRALGYLK